MLPAKLLKAMAWRGPLRLLMCGRIHLEEKWPKGNVQDCDPSRGLLLAEHMRKIPATILKRECDPHYWRTHSCISVWCCARPRSRHGSSHFRLGSSISICEFFVSCCFVFSTVLSEKPLWVTHRALVPIPDALISRMLVFHL